MTENHIVLNIFIPGINRVHNFISPNDMQIERVIALIVKTVSEEYPTVKYESMTKLRLFTRRAGQVLNPACSLKQLGIDNGVNLILA